MDFQRPDLAGRAAIVTGASRGIGKALALALARQGADVCVAARSVASRDRLPGSIHATAAEIEALGRRALAVRTDVRKGDEVGRMVEQALEGFGRVDILVNNAGALWWRDVTETPMKRFDLVMDVNCRAAFAACRHVLPAMIRQGGGHIVNLSPPVEPELLPGKVAYMISKFGMTLLARGLAAEVREQGVAVNALWPATLVESQASINHALGTPADWRKADVLADALLALLSFPTGEITGEALLDEEILARAGVTDLEPYSCVPGGTPIRITGSGAQWPRRGG